MVNEVTTRKSFQPTTIDEAMRFSDILSKSSMVPKEYQGKPANTLVAIQWGMELGLAPMQALQNIAVINGKPSVYGDALIALVRADSRCRGVSEHIEGQGDDMTAVCVIKRANGNEVEEIKRTFSVGQAKQARLWGKQGPWSQYPERMLQHRARGNAIRDGFPDVIKGLITAEEAQDFQPPKDITPAQKPVEPPKLEQLTAPKPAPKPKPKLEPKAEEKKLDVKSAFDAAISRAEEAFVPGEDDTPLMEYELVIPNKPPEFFETPETFSERYNDLMLAMRRADKLAPATRRTKLKELEQANDVSLSLLPLDLSKELQEKRLQYNKGLSLEEKEQGNG